MFARPIFNIMAVFLILAHALTGDAGKKISFIQIIFVIILISSLSTRPYRSLHSNVIYITLNFLMNLILFEMNLKISGFKSTLFVDKYFFWM